MKKRLVVYLALSAAAFAAPPAKKKAAAKAAPAPQAITIPKDAVPNGDGNTYTWTDKQGKKWIYAKTPFGIMKSAASENANLDAPAPDAAMMKAIDKGDAVRFERPGPFGTIAYEKKKSELSDSERALFEAQQPKTEQQ